MVYGINQPEAFFELLGYSYEIQPLYKYGRLIFLQNFGFQYAAIDELIFTKIRSYYYHKILITNSENAKNLYPKDGKDTIALIVLVNNDLKQIEHDYNTIKTLEENGGIYIKNGLNNAN